MENETLISSIVCCMGIMLLKVLKSQLLIEN